MHQSAKVKPRPSDGLQYPFAEPPLPGELREVASGVYWLRMPLPFALEHINLWLLADGEGWTIVDCGFGTDQTRALWQQIFTSSLDGKPVTRIVVTHFHPDHFGLAAWLADFWQAPVHMAAPEFTAAQGWFAGREPHRREAHVAMFRQHGLELGDGLQRENLFKRGVPALPASIVELHDGQQLTVNGRDWRVVTGYGHSPEHAALYCDELGILIAGDMVLPRISTNVSVQPCAPEADPLGRFMDSLTRYAELDAATLVLPSHGLPFRGLRERVASLKEHHVARLDELLVACARPHTGAQMMPVIFKRALDAQQTLFAMGETLSHINFLHSRGQLQRARGDDGIYRYARV
ncbi:MAG: MBL fold metallo-hydrolase [Betaproteobacteria bacterium]|nr:MBL fold metallo-hydrolase [Betaproteobacteria bacterium]